MNFINIRLKYLLLVGIVIVLWQQNSFAGGFPVRPGSLIISPSVNYFFADKGWDSLGRKSNYPYNGKYSSITYSTYIEYGISRRFSAVVSLPYTMINYQQSGIKYYDDGLTDLETGIKYYVANINYKYYFSIQGTAITPLYNNPNLGFRESGAELKLSFAGSGRLGSKNYSFNIDNGFRQYFGAAGPFQDRYSGSFALTLDRKFKHQLSITVGGFYSESETKQFIPNQAINKNFSFNQVALSYGYNFNKAFSVFLTGGTFVTGRNTGDGSSASVAFIIRPFKI